MGIKSYALDILNFRMFIGILKIYVVYSRGDLMNLELEKFEWRDGT